MEMKKCDEVSIEECYKYSCENCPYRAKKEDGSPNRSQADLDKAYAKKKVEQILTAFRDYFYVDAVKLATELANIVDKIYEDGFSDGQGEAEYDSQESREPMRDESRD